MELLCYGDSITFGYGVRMAARWTTLAAAETGISIVNRGLSGDTSSGMLVRLRLTLLDDRAALAVRPTVFLMGGTNDIFYSGTDQSARVNMGAMLQQLMAAGLRPVVGIPMGIGQDWFPADWSSVVDFPAASRVLDSYGDWLCAFCRVFRLPIVDFRPLFGTPDGGKRNELFLDGLHPNEAGHRLMADALIRFLREDMV